MILTKLQLVGPSIVDLPLEHQEVDGPYLLKGADGLNPVEVEILGDGKTRPQTREMVLLVGLQPQWDVGQRPEELRTELYNLVTSRYGAPIELRLMNEDDEIAHAVGIIKKMEVGLFTQDPEVQITIGCVEPTRSYFVAPVVINEKPAIPGGSNPVVSLDNPGTAPSGFRIGIQFTSAVAKATGVIITDNHTGGQSMKVYRDFVSGDRLFIDSRERQKGVWVQPAGQPGLLPIMEYFSVDSDWMTLHHGVNQLNVNQPFLWPASSTGGGIDYSPAYQGV